MMLDTVKRLIPNSVKRDIKRVSRISTSPIRVLPDFIIIGAQKCGTTSLFRYLEQHPCIFASSEKEVHYFDNNYSRGEYWYRSFFPVFIKTRGAIKTGEASPYYLFHPLVPKRISMLLPRAKLVVLLRNPTDRAVSQYHHNVRLGFENLKMMEALRVEEKRIENEELKMIQDSNYYSYPYQTYSYKKRGIYIDQLENYWKYFDKKQIFIVNSTRVFKSPVDVLREVSEFIGVSTNELENVSLAERNVGKNKGETPSEVVDYLNGYFRPYNQRLVDALGEEFADWV